MSNLDRRLSRLEAGLAAEDDEPRVVIVTINPNNLPEDHFRIDLNVWGLWAIAARGGPFTENEIGALKEKYKGHRGLLTNKSV